MMLAALTPAASQFACHMGGGNQQTDDHLPLDFLPSMAFRLLG
jgi:hypothetical protein